MVDEQLWVISASHGPSDLVQPVEWSPDCRFLRVCSTQYKEELCRTPMKVIFRALDNEMGRQVSWHEVSLHHVSKEDLPKIKDDLELIKTLQHPNLINWIAQWHSESANSMVFITELIPEGSLREYMQKIKAPRLKVVKQWTRQLLEALLYLHSRKPFPYIYGYLTPENLYYLPTSGKIKIGGLGKSVVFHNGPSQVCMRRYEYVAPEVLQGEPSTGVDIYCLGMCILEICTQSIPYDECKTPVSITRRIVTGHKPLSLSRIQNEEVKDFIALCLSPLEHRPSAEELFTHPFFLDSGEAGSRPVMLKAKVEGHSLSENEGNTIEVEMIIPPANGRAQRKIEFPFDLDVDTPDSVAEEMVEELHLPQELTPTLSRQISSHLGPALHLDKPSLSSSRESFPDSDIAFRHHEEMLKLGDLDSKEVLALFSREKGETHSPSTASRSSFANAMESASKDSLMSSRSLSPNETTKEPGGIKGRISTVLSVNTQIHGETEIPKMSPVPVPPSPRLSITQLKHGQDNCEDDVRMLQTALQTIYGSAVQVNGQFGRKTEVFVKRFQEEKEMEVTGVVTMEMWTRVYAEYRARKNGKQTGDIYMSSTPQREIA